jgi:YARHG domain
MKRCWTICICLIALLATACWSEPTLSGSYVGEFVADRQDLAKSPMRMNKINLSIDSVEGSIVRGHSVVAGNNRPFSGTLTKKANKYVIEAKEPGDDPYDGTFLFALYPETGRVNGTWSSNDKTLAVTRRKYQLERKTFRYDPSQALEGRRIHQIYGSYNPDTDESEALTEDAWKYNASTTALTTEIVENMYKRDLEVIRNTIYARHGYSFQNREMRYIFDRIPWYIPMSTDVTAQLTPLEKKNIEILKRYENHAANYYDKFGR